MAIRETEEFQRIRDIPRERWQDTITQDDIVNVTSRFLTPRGKRTLRVKLQDPTAFPEAPVPMWPAQVAVLMTMAKYRRAFVTLPPGNGKTLPSLLIHTMLGIRGRDAALIIPPSMFRELNRTWQELSKYYKIDMPQVLRYSEFSRASLDDDLIATREFKSVVMDESHFIKNGDAARTRKILRGLKALKDPALCYMSGTLMPTGPLDAWHYLNVGKPDLLPLPRAFKEAEAWSTVLTPRPMPGKFMGTGELVRISGQEPDPNDKPRLAARKSWAAVWEGSPLVVSSAPRPTGCGLEITNIVPPFPKRELLAQHFSRLRNEMRDLNGEEFSDQLTLWRHARELVCGLHMLWEVPAPPEWLDARNEFIAYVRSVLQLRMKGIDSPTNAIQYIETSMPADHQSRAILARWQKIKPTFKPRTRPVWGDTQMLEFAAQWVEDGDSDRSIVWVEHPAFGYELSRRTKLPFFNVGGLDSSGKFIADAKGPIIAGIRSNGTGRDGLQKKWNRGLCVSFPGTGASMEQLIARLDRPGSPFERVTWELVTACSEQWNGIVAMLEDAAWASDGMNEAQRVHRAISQFRRPADLL